MRPESVLDQLLFLTLTLKYHFGVTLFHHVEKLHVHALIKVPPPFWHLGRHIQKKSEKVPPGLLSWFITLFPFHCVLTFLKFYHFPQYYSLRSLYKPLINIVTLSIKLITYTRKFQKCCTVQFLWWPKTRKRGLFLASRRNHQNGRTFSRSSFKNDFSCEKTRLIRLISRWQCDLTSLIEIACDVHQNIFSYFSEKKHFLLLHLMTYEDSYHFTALYNGNMGISGPAPP